MGTIIDDASRRWLNTLAKRYDLSPSLLEEYFQLFQEHGIPVVRKRRATTRADRIVMISTHGYWGDPPPAGVPDTGGQTYYVLETSKAWAKQGRKVIILARWFKPYPRVEQFGKNVWLVRIQAGGDKFVRKEDIYPLVPEMAEAEVAISLLFNANTVMGHYADGMAGSVEVGERLKVPTVVIPHSIGIKKVLNLGFDPLDPETWLDDQYNFWTRESFEFTALHGANLEIANTPAEPAVLKEYYNAAYPHLIMPAGAGQYFFDAYRSKRARLDILKPLGLSPNRYMLFFGRFSEAKNIPGVVAVFGETRRLDPERFKSMKLVLVGGDPKKPMDEELHVEEEIKKMMQRYDLTDAHVVRIPSEGWEVLSVLAHNCLFYVGMQMMEPFGMGVAEAMAAGAPVVISKNAGISRWLTDGVNAIIVDPEDPAAAAKRLVEKSGDPGELKLLSMNGFKRAKEAFSWLGIARLQGQVLDRLCQDEVVDVDNPSKTFDTVMMQRDGRAYHRLSFAWRGDPPIIRPKHKQAAEGLLPYIKEAVKKARASGQRVSIALGGESGAGKTEIAEFLRYRLRQEKIWGMTLPGDAFFKKPPAENHHARLKAYDDGKLTDYLGPQEVDLDRLDSILGAAIDCKTTTLFVPSDCRSLGSRRYDNVPADITGRDVILVDLTYGLKLKNITLKVFLESDYTKRIEEIKERNRARDPDQDFNFILKVLEIEHHIIQNLKRSADIIVSQDYQARPNRETLS